MSNLDIYESYMSGTAWAGTKVEGSNIWEKHGHKRRYYTLTTDDPRRGITNLWEILDGSERAQHNAFVNGRSYGYETGPFANSHVKQQHIADAVEKIIKQIQETEREEDS